MFIIFGFGHKTFKDFGVYEQSSCAQCHNTIEYRKLKVTTWFTLLFIPIIPYRVEYLAICPICKNFTHIDQKQFVNSGEAFDSESVSGSNVDRYAGKTETQIAYLKQMEEINQRKEQL